MVDLSTIILYINITSLGLEVIIYFNSLNLMQIKVPNYFIDKAHGDGDGVGDDKRLNFALKSFLNWCDADYGDSPEW